MSGSVAGVVIVGTSGVFTKLDNWETTTLEGFLNVGIKEGSQEEGKPSGIISRESSEMAALSGVVALSG